MGILNFMGQIIFLLQQITFGQLYIIILLSWCTYNFITFNPGSQYFVILNVTALFVLIGIMFYLKSVKSDPGIYWTGTCYETKNSLAITSDIRKAVVTLKEKIKEIETVDLLLAQKNGQDLKVLQSDVIILKQKLKELELVKVDEKDNPRFKVVKSGWDYNVTYDEKSKEYIKNFIADSDTVLIACPDSLDKIN